MATLNPSHVGAADHVSVRLDYDTVLLIKGLARERGLSVSDVLRDAICSYVGSPVSKRRTYRKAVA